MIDYRNLHSKIKAALKPDSPMPEGWEMLPERQNFMGVWRPLATQVVDGISVEAGHCYLLQEDWKWCPPASIEWFAEALGIPLEDNGYTDLVKAAELVIKINTAFRSGVDLEEWAESANDGEIDLGAALERIKSENQ